MHDDTAQAPVFLVLPGQESFAPERPLAFAEGLDAGWENDTFGVGFEFDSLASLDERGAVAAVRGGVPVKIFGNAFDLMHFDARAQVVPSIDPGAVPAGETSGFALDLEVLSLTVYSYRRELGYVFDGSFSISKEKKFTRQFFVGPVPVSAAGGVVGEIGYQLTADLQSTSLTSTAGPFVRVEAMIEAGVGIAGLLQAGAGGALTLLDERFQGSATTGLAVVSVGSPAVFEGSVVMNVTNTVTGPTGRIYLFVEYPGLKWCRACVFGICIPYPCGFKTVRKELGLVTWQSFRKEDLLFDKTLCKRVTLGGSPSPGFSVCITPP